MARRKADASGTDEYGQSQDKSESRSLKGPEPNLQRAKTWWGSMNEEERDEHRSGFETAHAPKDEELIKAYADAHSGEPEPEEQIDGTEPPAEHPATPGASATNPELMKNDPPAGTPLYDRTTLPPGTPIPEAAEDGTPTVAYAFERGEPLDEHQTLLREKEAKEKEERDKFRDQRAADKRQYEQDFKTDEKERVKAKEKRQAEEYASQY